MSVIESGLPSFDTDFTSHSPRKTRKPCFFVHMSLMSPKVYETAV